MLDSINIWMLDKRLGMSDLIKLGMSGYVRLNFDNNFLATKMICLVMCYKRTHSRGDRHPMPFVSLF